MRAAEMEMWMEAAAIRAAEAEENEDQANWQAQQAERKALLAKRESNEARWEAARARRAAAAASPLIWIH